MYTLYTFDKVNNIYKRIAVVDDFGTANWIALKFKEIYPHVYGMKGKGLKVYDKANGLQLFQLF